MKSNKFFSLKRFSRFFGADLRLNKKYYFFCFAGMAVGLYIIFLLNMRYSLSENGYQPLFVLGLLGLGAFVGDAFNDLNSKTKTANYLLLPVSIFEKILSQFVIRFVFGVGLFLLLFWVDAYLARETQMIRMAGNEKIYEIAPFHYSLLYKWVNDYMLFSVMICVSIGLFLFAGRLFFGRFGLIKTIIAGLAAFLLIVCCFPLFSHLFYPAETHGFDVKLPMYELFDGITNMELFVYGIAYFSWLFLLPLAYFKLKEKQV